MSWYTLQEIAKNGAHSAKPNWPKDVVSPASGKQLTDEDFEALSQQPDYQRLLGYASDVNSIQELVAYLEKYIDSDVVLAASYQSTESPNTERASVVAAGFVSGFYLAVKMMEEKLQPPF